MLAGLVVFATPNSPDPGRWIFLGELSDMDFESRAVEFGMLTVRPSVWRRRSCSGVEETCCNVCSGKDGVGVLSVL